MMATYLTRTDVLRHVLFSPDFTVSNSRLCVGLLFVETELCKEGSYAMMETIKTEMGVLQYAFYKIIAAVLVSLLYAS